jgi:hypothetical protein
VSIVSERKYRGVLGILGNIPRLRVALSVSRLLKPFWIQKQIKVMTTSTNACRLAKIIGICTVLTGLCSCTFRSEDEFAQQNGFRRSDYFGQGSNRNYVPCAVQNPDYYISDREIPTGKPSYSREP